MRNLYILRLFLELTILYKSIVDNISRGNYIRKFFGIIDIIERGGSGDLRSMGRKALTAGISNCRHYSVTAWQCMLFSPGSN